MIRHRIVRRAFSFLCLSLVLPVLGTFAHAAPKKASAAPQKSAPLHFTRYGHGPAVAFLHGLGGDSASFIGELQLLEKNHTVLLIDLPGHGQSPAQPIINLQNIAKQVGELLDGQHVGPAVIVGHSMGGTLAGYVALADPKAVRGLVIIDSMFSPYPIPRAARDKLRFELNRDQISALRSFMTPMAHDIAQVDKLVAAAQLVKPTTFMGYAEWACEHDDLMQHAAEIQVPVHVMATSLLTGGQSSPPQIQAALGRVGYANVPKLSFDYFPTAKHWLHWDDPAGFDTSLQKFLTRVEADAAISAAPLPIRRTKQLAKAAGH